MNQELCILTSRTIQEYADTFSAPQRPIDLASDDYWVRVEETLEREMEWTQDGAANIAALARKYGAFMLRNALVLASVLGIEDGELGC